eukprot:1631143-Rhodomonas_salina.1
MTTTIRLVMMRIRIEEDQDDGVCLYWCVCLYWWLEDKAACAFQTRWGTSTPTAPARRMQSTSSRECRVAYGGWSPPCTVSPSSLSWFLVGARFVPRNQQVLSLHHAVTQAALRVFLVW